MCNSLSVAAGCTALGAFGLCTVAVCELLELVKKENVVKGTVEDVIKDGDGQRYVIYYPVHDMTVRAVTPRYKENEKYVVGDSVMVAPFVDRRGERKARVVDKELEQLHNKDKTERVALIVASLAIIVLSAMTVAEEVLPWF